MWDDDDNGPDSGSDGEGMPQLTAAELLRRKQRIQALVGSYDDEPGRRPSAAALAMGGDSDDEAVAPGAARARGDDSDDEEAVAASEGHRAAFLSALTGAVVAPGAQRAGGDGAQSPAPSEKEVPDLERDEEAAAASEEHVSALTGASAVAPGAQRAAGDDSDNEEADQGSEGEEEEKADMGVVVTTRNL